MNASVLIEVIGLLLGGGGGGAVVAKLTRLVVGVETLTEKIETVIGDARDLVTQVQQLEVRLAQLEAVTGPAAGQPGATPPRQG